MTEKRLIQTCDECYFFKSEDEGGGPCRRLPPVPIATNSNHGEDTEIETAGPWVENNGWCGEWKTKEEGLPL